MDNKHNTEPSARGVKQLVVPQHVTEGAGVQLRRSIATRTLDNVDPFLLFDDFSSDNPDDYMAGFPIHPHRGIETVTYMISGEVNHRDSIGNAGTIGPGDVQWMTAGRGILHEEMPKMEKGLLAGFQLWVNLPARDKMMPPRYQDVPNSTIHELQREDGTRIRVITGTVDGITGPVNGIVAEPIYLDVTVPAHTAFQHGVTAGHAAFAYVFKGEGRFGITKDNIGHDCAAPMLVIFDDGDTMRVRAGDAGVRFLLISGLPIGEPIARYGPFVMNTREEIQQTLRELQSGNFPPK
ncbi:MAG: pirin family protein [Anaerolineales bacterium]|nr:MAG: pirin family protein [Anaerolineales bacterium]